MPEMAAPFSTLPPAQPLATKLAMVQPGVTTPMNTSSSTMASTVTKSSKAAAMPTPIQLSPMKITYAPSANHFGLTPGNCTLRYAPMASAMAGGAKTNSISVAKPATKPPLGPKARRA